MRIAVTYEKDQVFQHFGHTERFKIYDIEDGNVVISTIINTNGSGHGALPDILRKIDVDTLICGGIGDGAKLALSEANIKLYCGVSGDTDKAVDDFLADKLEFHPEVVCDRCGKRRDGPCGSHDNNLK